MSEGPMAPDPRPPAPGSAPIWRPAPGAPGAGGGASKRGGSGAWIGVMLGVLLLGSCFVMGIVVLGAAATAPDLDGGGRVVTRTVSGSGDARIAVIPVHGAISSGAGGGLFAIPDTVETTRGYLERAAKDEDVKAVILEIASPGGEVTACDLIHGALTKCRAEAKKPIVAYLEGQAASGGYYIAVATQRIVCYRTTITGSIGVRMDFWNVAELAAKHGVQQYSITSGENKDMLPFARKPTEESLAIARGMVDDMYARFLEVILAGRPGLTKDALLPLADGRILTAQQALDGKLVDAVGTFDDAVAEAKKLAGLSEATVVRYERQIGLFGPLMQAASAGRGPSAIIRELQDAAAPRLLFLAGR